MIALLLEALKCSVCQDYCFKHRESSMTAAMHPWTAGENLKHVSSGRCCRSAAVMHHCHC
jgi:hypothetical protein